MERLRNLGACAGYSAAFVQAIAFTWYCIIVFSHDAHTNPISWWLWLGETLVGLVIYIDHTRDTPKWINEAVAFVGVIMVASYLALRIFMGDTAIVLAPVETIDIVVAVATVATFCFWVLTREKLGAGISLWIFQIALVAAAFPLIRATFVDPSAEPFWPWALWTLSFSLQLLSASLRWDDIEALLNPLNYAATHGLVALIVWHSVAP